MDANRIRALLWHDRACHSWLDRRGAIALGRGRTGRVGEKSDDAKQNFRKAAVLTWEAAERLALTSPEDANRLAAESLAFEGLATSMRARAAVGLERTK